MKKIIGIILIIVALGLGYIGADELSSSTASVDILGVEITAEDNSAKEMAYVKIGLGVIALIAGVYLIGKKER
ncbi:MAG: hypothetical protein PHO13_01260 [Fermentimonas sp.]|jgi:hypothetical protein|nr:hypothetical protein [Fermentimonas sp.]NLC86233.1 hypothetical protein [Bacteroidales bacterium]HBT86137.1 hypothetical protein [Porphyromonadaceae bacterium]MDD2931610.1 hypothetical protein [Fermentimonas sp.]MDD3188107.1 hypothetical protein [Fermentimonas sp.]